MKVYFQLLSLATFANGFSAPISHGKRSATVGFASNYLSSLQGGEPESSNFPQVGTMPGPQDPADGPWWAVSRQAEPNAPPPPQAQGTASSGGVSTVRDGNLSFKPNAGSAQSMATAAPRSTFTPARSSAPPQTAPQPREYKSPVPKGLWDTSSVAVVQGDSLRTWSLTSAAIDRVAVVMKTDGRPLNADVELWEGPDNTPQKMKVYIEDGALRPFRAVIETPGGQNAIAIRNTGFLEFPLSAAMGAELAEAPPLMLDTKMALDQAAKERVVQGGALTTYPFDPSVKSVQIMLKTDGRPLNARIELLQGPNNNKQVIEMYLENGVKRPFYAVLETPGVGNVLRVMNRGPLEFPMIACVKAYETEEVVAGDMPLFVIDKK